MAFGTFLYTLVYGKHVGTDAFGNKYYRGKLKDGNHVGRADKERRWVIYKDKAEASLVPPEWHGWLHYIIDEIPTEKESQKKHNWQKPHLPNLTGTSVSYRPKGHILSGGKRAKATGDYEAWQPSAKNKEANNA